MDDTTMMILIVVLMYVMMTKSCGSTENFTNSWTPFLPKNKVDCSKVGNNKDDCCNCVQRYAPFGEQRAKDSCKAISCNAGNVASGNTHAVHNQATHKQSAHKKVSKPCTGRLGKGPNIGKDCQTIYNNLVKNTKLEAYDTQEKLDDWCKNMPGCTFGTQAATTGGSSLSLADLKGMNLRELCKKL